jgi:sugar/nucleoside kinase (ribokinase family)
MGILVVGSVAIDNVITPFGKNFNAPGGSATFFSLSASYFTDVKLVAVVGEDFPKRYIRCLSQKGVDIKGLDIKKGKTFRWKGSYANDLDNAETISTHLNLFKDFRPVLPKAYINEEVLFLANIDPVLQLDVLRQARSRLTAADTIGLWIKTKQKELLEVLKRIDIFFINEHEARELTKENNLVLAGKKIISFGPKKVIIKKGENGLLYVSREGFFVLPAYPLEKVVDPTGAGDTFAGGFLGYLASQRNINEKITRQALVYGSVMATFTVEDYDIKGLLKLNQKTIDSRARRFKDLCVI